MSHFRSRDAPGELMKNIYEKSLYENDRVAVFERVVNHNYIMRNQIQYRRLFNKSQDLSASCCESKTLKSPDRRVIGRRVVSVAAASPQFGSPEPVASQKEAEILSTLEAYVRNVADLNQTEAFEQELTKKLQSNNVKYNLGTQQAYDFKKKLIQRVKAEIKQKERELMVHPQSKTEYQPKKAAALRPTQRLSYLSRINEQISHAKVPSRNQSELRNTENSLISGPDDKASAISSMDCVSEIYRQKLKANLQTVKVGDSQNLKMMAKQKEDVMATTFVRLLEKAGDEKNESNGFKLGMGRFRGPEEVQSQTNNMLYCQSLRRPRRVMTCDESFKRSTVERIIREKQERNPSMDPKAVELGFKKIVKQRGILDVDSIESSKQAYGFDKFGRERDPKKERDLENMLRPRKVLREANRLSLGEQRLFKRLEAIGQEKSFGFEADSLVQSAFDSSVNKEWEAYKFSVENPQVTEVSQEQVNLFASVDHSVVEGDKLREDDPDAFAECNDSGSSLSSDYSFQKSFSEQDNPKIGQTELTRYFDGDISMKNIEKYCFFKIIDGLKLPMLKGCATQRFSISDIIEISSNLVRKSQRQRKFSSKMLQKIIETYQREFGSAPLDLLKGMTIRGHIFLKNYKMSEAQLNAFSCIVPYVLNLRYVNLQNCNVKDEQAALIVKGLAMISKIQSILLGQNTIGPKFVEQLRKQPLLMAKIKELSLCNMVSSSLRQFNSLFALLPQFTKLQNLDISGNVLNNESAKQLSEYIPQAKHLEILNLSSSLQSSEASRKVLKSLVLNQSIKYLNLSNNRFCSTEYEFGSIIGRLIQCQEILVHLNISCCKLSQPEMMFIAMAMRSNFGLKAVHMGLNNINYAGRCMLRQILQAQVKHPFRSKIKICDFIRTSQDKQQVLILNTYIMSGLPEDFGTAAVPPADTKYDSGQTAGKIKVHIPLSQMPIRNMSDVRERIAAMSQQQLQQPNLQELTPAPGTGSEVQEILSQRASRFSKHDDDQPQKKHCNQLLKRVDAILKEKEEAERAELDKYFGNTESKESVSQTAQIQKKVELNILGRLRDHIIDIQEESKGSRVTEYFENKQTRIYDMVHFMDVYGLKAQLQQSNPVKEIQRKLDRMPTISLGKSNEYQISKGSTRQKRQILTIEDVFDHKRELQMMKNLRSLVEAQGTRNNEMIERVQEIFAWGFLVHDLDSLERDPMVGFNPMQRPQKELVFQRILDQPDLNNKDEEGNVIWEDTSQCFICQKHNKISIQIDKEIVDEDFKELTHLSSILYDENQIAQQITKTRAPTRGLSFLPVFEDVFEQVSCSPGVRRARSTEEDESEAPSSTALYRPDDAIVINEFKAASSARNSSTSSSELESIWLEYGSEDEDKQEPPPLEKPKKPVPVPKRYFDFKPHSTGRNMMPLASIQNTDMLAHFAQSALTMDRHLYNPSICGMPISVRSLNQVASQQATITPEMHKQLETYNKFASKNDRRIIRNGVLFKNFSIRNDLMDFGPGDLESDVLTSVEDQQEQIPSESEDTLRSSQQSSLNEHTVAETGARATNTIQGSIIEYAQDSIESKLREGSKASKTRGVKSKASSRSNTTRGQSAMRRPRKSFQAETTQNRALANRTAVQVEPSLATTPKMLKRLSTTISQYKSPRKTEQIYHLTSYFLYDPKQQALLKQIHELQEKIDSSLALNRLSQKKDMKENIQKLKRRQIDVQKKSIKSCMKYALKKQRLFLIGDSTCSKLERMVSTLSDYRVALAILYVDKYTQKAASALLDAKARTGLIQDSFLSLTGGERAFPQMFISELFIGSSHSALVSKIKSKKLFQLLDQAGISYNSKTLDGKDAKKDQKTKEEVARRLQQHLGDYRRVKKEEIKDVTQVQAEVGRGLPETKQAAVAKKEGPVLKQDSLLDCFRKTIQNKWFQLRQAKPCAADAPKVMYLIASFNHWFPIKMAEDHVPKIVIKQSFKDLSQSSPAIDKSAGNLTNEPSVESSSSDEPADAFKYSEFVPSGDHYFYFVNRHNEYCLSRKYEVVTFPGTSLRMNRIHVEELQAHDMNLVRYRQTNTTGPMG